MGVCFGGILTSLRLAMYKRRLKGMRRVQWIDNFVQIYFFILLMLLLHKKRICGWVYSPFVWRMLRKHSENIGEATICMVRFAHLFQVFVLISKIGIYSSRWNWIISGAQIYLHIDKTGSRWLVSIEKRHFTAIINCRSKSVLKFARQFTTNSIIPPTPSTTRQFSFPKHRHWNNCLCEMLLRWRQFAVRFGLTAHIITIYVISWMIFLLSNFNSTSLMLTYLSSEFNAYIWHYNKEKKNLFASPETWSGSISCVKGNDLLIRLVVIFSRQSAQKFKRTLKTEWWIWSPFKRWLQTMYIYIQNLHR